MRGLGVSKQDRTVLDWDRHGSHAYQPLLTFQESENLEGICFPSHTTNWVQLQDADRGQFSVLKRESRKDIDAWNAHLFRQNQHLAMEDFHSSYNMHTNSRSMKKWLERLWEESDYSLLTQTKYSAECQTQTASPSTHSNLSTMRKQTLQRQAWRLCYSWCYSLQTSKAGYKMNAGRSREVCIY